MLLSIYYAQYGAWKNLKSVIIQQFKEGNERAGVGSGIAERHITHKKDKTGWEE